MSTFYHPNQLASIPATPGIYQIRCLINDRFYVGSAVNLYQRWNDHKSDLRRNEHPNKKLQNAWNKYTESNFVFEILEYVLLPEMLTAREQAWFKKLRPFDRRGYNILPLAGSSLGYKHTPESLEKLRANSSGRKHTPESIEKMSRVQKGHPTSPETRQKIGDAHRGNTWNKGKKRSQEAIEQHRQSLTGYKHTEEAKRNMAKAQTGRVHSQESRDKRSASLKGHETSPEARAKIGAAHKGMKHTPEARARIKAGLVGRVNTTAAHEARRKTLIVTSPEGVEYVVHGIRQFAIEHGLDSSSLSKVARGKQSHAHGWTARFPDHEEDAS